MTLEPFYLERLRAHQRDPACFLQEVHRRHNSAVDGSDTGTGKTYTNAAVASASKLPTLIVCPKIAQSAWRKAASHFDDSFSIVGYEMLRGGRTDFGHWDNRNPVADTFYRCTECLCTVVPGGFPCHVRRDGIHCVEVKKKPIRYGRFHFHPAIRNIIFDEAHRCNGLDSLNADMLIAARRQAIRTTALSATLASSPIQMRALGYLLGLHNLDTDLCAPGKLVKVIRPNFERWLRKQNCQWLKEFHGWKWMVGKDSQLEAMRQLRAQIFPEHGIRISWKDIPSFPARTIEAELYDLEESGKIDSLYKEMAEAIGALREKKRLDKSAEHPLTILLRARQEIELIKVPVITELAEDYLAKGFSVVLFMNYTQTIDELFKRFPQFRVIDGRSLKKRDKFIEQFQSNDVPGLIVQNEAGKESMSLQDLDGFHPRVGLVSPTFSANTMRQIFGRLHRDFGLSPCFYKVIFAAGTVEVPVHRAIQPKLNNLDALNDGDCEPANLVLH